MKSFAIADEYAAQRLWPALRASGMFRTRHEYDAYRAAAPWRILASAGGRAAVVERWREHLDILAIRGLWCLEHEVPDAIADLSALASDQGFDELLSPLLSEDVVKPYLAAGMRVVHPTVVLRLKPSRYRSAIDAGTRGAGSALPGLEVRLAVPDDLAALARLDAECFEPFWRNDAPRMADLLTHGHCGVAVDGDGVLLGYTHATIEHGEGRIGRLAVDPGHRRLGVGRVLLGHIVGFLARAGVCEMTLCTQVENEASRALYAAMGFTEMEKRAVFLIRDARTDSGRGGR